MPRRFTNADLGALKEHLEAQARKLRLERIAAIHAASLPQPAAHQGQAAR
jgi:hypothetical protein